MRAAADRRRPRAPHRTTSASTASSSRRSGNQTLLDLWTSLRVEARTVITIVKDHSTSHEIAEITGR